MKYGLSVLCAALAASAFALPRVKISDVLAMDADDGVRAEVAKMGFALEELSGDPSWVVRSEVAKKGHGLPGLVLDPDWRVRAIVAQKGFGFDLLAGDSEPLVRAAVEKSLEERGCSLDEWIRVNPGLCALPGNRTEAREETLCDLKAAKAAKARQPKAAPGAPAIKL